MGETEVRYFEREGKHLAYTVFGSGPIDILMVQSAFPIDLMWELPQLAEFMDSLGRMARVIVYDNRGHGASDSLPEPDVAPVEDSASDALAVLDAAGSDRATVLGLNQNHPVLMAAFHPERVRSLIACHLRAAFPEVQNMSAANRMKFVMKLRTVEGLRFVNPRVAHDPVLQRWWLRANRLLNPPDQQLRNMEWAALSSIDSILATVPVPVLVLHRRDNRVWDIESSRAVAARIPGARFVDLPGAENDIFLGDTAPVLAEIQQFLTQPGSDVVADRSLATVLFTDFVGSTEHLARHGDAGWRAMLDRHDESVDRLVAAHRGKVVKQLGDGTLATFDGPARAVRCAAELISVANEQGLDLRAGLHTGEIELRTSDVAGMAVHIASRIAALAGANQILVSRTLVDLTWGSGLEFEPRGEHELKGVPGSWPVFAASADR